MSINISKIHCQKYIIKFNVFQNLKSFKKRLFSRNKYILNKMYVDLNFVCLLINKNLIKILMVFWVLKL